MGVKVSCTICSKGCVNIIRHLKRIHSMKITNAPPASDIESFAKLLSHIPLTASDLCILASNAPAMRAFLTKGKELPHDLIKVLSYGLMAYNRKPVKLTTTTMSSANKNDNSEEEDDDSKEIPTTEAVNGGCFSRIKNVNSTLSVEKRKPKRRRKLTKRSEFKRKQQKRKVYKQRMNINRH